MKDRIASVSDILMGAAYADGRLHGDEKLAIKRLLGQVLGEKALPMDLQFRIDEFDSSAFDVKAAAAAFANDDAPIKRKLLELVAAVHGADHEYDMAEDEYVRQLAAALGVPEEQYADLVTTLVEEIDLASAMKTVRFSP